MNQNTLVLFLVSIFCVSTFFNQRMAVSCQNVDIDDDNKTTVERPYCFRFTWIGPKYNEESQFKNATCGDIVRDDKTVPCTHPLVVTS